MRKDRDIKRKAAEGYLQLKGTFKLEKLRDT